MVKNFSSSKWLHRHINDQYVKLAKCQGYRARAAYKLKEIDERNHLIHQGQTIIDLGAAPGSWSQYVRKKLSVETCKSKINGRIIAIDILPIAPIPGVIFIQGNFGEESVLYQLEELLGGRKVDLVISDMAPNLSGVSVADSARIRYICDLALEFSQVYMKAEGSLLMKCFHGSGYSQIVKNFKSQFKYVMCCKPKASYDSSSETFILGRQLKWTSQSF